MLVTKEIKKKKKKVNYYFTSETEEAVIQFNSDKLNQTEKDKIFKDTIHPALLKLTEGLINKYKFYHISDTILDTQYLAINFLLDKMYTFNPEKGKAYSYFTRIALNFLIYENLKAYKRKTQHVYIDSDVNSHTTLDELISHEPEHSKLFFFDLLITYLEHNINILFTDEDEIAIVTSIIMLLKKCHSLDKLNKKAIYFQIQEISNASQPKITNVIKYFRQIYSELFNFYTINEYLDVRYIPLNFNETVYLYKMNKRQLW